MAGESEIERIGFLVWRGQILTPTSLSLFNSLSFLPRHQSTKKKAICDFFLISMNKPFFTVVNFFNILLTKSIPFHIS